MANVPTTTKTTSSYMIKWRRHTTPNRFERLVCVRACVWVCVNGNWFVPFVGVDFYGAVHRFDTTNGCEKCCWWRKEKTTQAELNKKHTTHTHTHVQTHTHTRFSLTGAVSFNAILKWMLMCACVCWCIHDVHALRSFPLTFQMRSHVTQLSQNKTMYKCMHQHIILKLLFVCIWYHRMFE